MKVRFASRHLEALFERGAGARRYPVAVVRGFQGLIHLLRAAPGLNDLYAIRSLHFEKLRGDRLGERSLRLNDQYRLVVRIEDPGDGPEVVVLEIVDYH